MTVDQIKQRFGIIGHSPLLNHAIDTAMQVAPTDISVLVTGESGTGKEVFPQIIHQMSARKHGPYIAVNCGAIPEGTIDSELFGHEKGSFTGAHEARKGYFEVADGGTVFLDEVAELPMSTQVRLLRVLETGEFIKVGSSKGLKTNVRIVAATNVDIPEAIRKEKFREDLYYRLNTVPILIPSLRERQEDIPLLFRKFAGDFAEKYRMPSVRLNDEARMALMNFQWPGNIRQLKNITEQISIIEKEREIDAEKLGSYLPNAGQTNLPAIRKATSSAGDSQTDFSERELMYKVLFDMKRDINDLKKLVLDVVSNKSENEIGEHHAQTIRRLHQDVEPTANSQFEGQVHEVQVHRPGEEPYQEPREIEESLSLEEREIELIKKALERHRGKRKAASQELGISERTLYRKIKEHNLG
ncbi:MAG: sigma-54 dependent transcriptional regulator [Flavobacteriales bacterium]|jgi:transcriptional regulator with PAS, ATPase and Fis domain|nr:sigma-54 dependent transcriptional regulator [Flavobacteriales bacterium]